MTAHSVSAGQDAKRAADGAFAFSGVKNVPLNFQIGEWRLFSVRRPLAVYECKDRAAPVPSDSLPSLENAEGYLLKGLPAPLLLDAAVRSKWFARVLRAYPRHLVDLTMGYDAYLNKFTGKTRSTLKRKLRKFQDLSGGAIDWKEYRTPEELREFLPVARAVSATTYQERLLRAGLPNTTEFTNDTLALAAADRVRAYILFLGKQPVSYLFLPIMDGRVVYAYLGYDPSTADHSPGTVLQLLAMERLFGERKFTVFDFTEGAGQHKELFATHTERCVDMIVLKRTLSAYALSATHVGFTRFEQSLSHALERLGVRKSLKRLLRALAPQR